MSKRVRLLFICNIVLMVGSAAVYAFVKQGHKIEEGRKTDHAYKITEIVQTGPEKALLPTLYLCELLDLSVDRMRTIYEIDLAEAREKLLSSPLIEEAKLSVMKPGTLYIDYTTLRPYMILGDLSNRAIDERGRVIPLAPYFPPKSLPKLYMGLQGECESLEGDALLEQAKEIFLAFHALPVARVDSIDVSQAENPSLGKREIVVTVQYPNTRHFLRLAPRKVAKELANYFSLMNDAANEEREGGDRMIDLRIDGLAFIEDM